MSEEIKERDSFQQQLNETDEQFRQRQLASDVFVAVGWPGMYSTETENTPVDETEEPTE